MPSFKVTHVREQGQDMIIFPLESTFGSRSENEQSEALEELQSRAHAAGLAGQAVAVWESSGRMHFIGPRPWHGFLQSISMRWVALNVNKQISW